ncbi:hypothetical protein [Microbacterium sp.]|uniref:hypothetical protein n=1 Tax=Microbacterium sp. TaxID=51671 RepID=UPI0026123422|nr:hypothetical protein [Microbacterium sp.]
MTERRALPYFLMQNAFATARADEFGLSRGRMRASDLQSPFRGVRSEGLDLDNLVHRCRAAATFMTEQEAFCHSTALGLWGAPLPAGLDSAAGALHIATRGTTRRRRAGVVGHRLATQTQLQASPDGLVTVAPAAAWCQFASQRGDRTREKMLLALVATGDYLITGRRIPGGREPAACTLTQLQHAIDAHGRARGARLLAEALPLGARGRSCYPYAAGAARA